MLKPPASWPCVGRLTLKLDMSYDRVSGYEASAYLDKLFSNSWAYSHQGANDACDIHVHPDFANWAGKNAGSITGRGYTITFFRCRYPVANNEELLLLLNQGE